MTLSERTSVVEPGPPYRTYYIEPQGLVKIVGAMGSDAPLRKKLRDHIAHATENQQYFIGGFAPSFDYRRIQEVHSHWIREKLSSSVANWPRVISSHSVESVIRNLLTNGWNQVASRLRAIQVSMKEDLDGEIDAGSAQTLSRVIQAAARVPCPRIGAGDDGTLDAVWSLGSDGIFTVECFGDGQVGCAVLLDMGARSHSRRMGVDEASALINCFYDLELLSRDAA